MTEASSSSARTSATPMLVARHNSRLTRRHRAAAQGRGQAVAGPEPGSRLGGGHPFYVGDWVVEPATGRITRGSRQVKLEPRVMDLLVCLASSPGRVMTRDELESVVWARMVVGYDSLTNAMIKLRKALDDNSRHPRFIETVAKRGYRLIADVKPAEPADLPRRRESPSRQFASPRRFSLYVGIVLLLVTAVLGWRLSSLHPLETKARRLPPRPRQRCRSRCYRSAIAAATRIKTTSATGSRPI